MKVRLKDNEFEQYNGTIIDAELDTDGDVILPEHISRATGRHYAFTSEYEVVSEDVIPGGYTLELQAAGLTQLHAILDVLPESVLDSATLKTN